MSIGAVLALLRPEFPDVTISKIRFLEDQGLVEPDRTPSGYRKFNHADVERLRYVLSVQRDHYLPLRVIREHLDAMDRGRQPPPIGGAPPRAARLVGAPEPASRPGLPDDPPGEPGARLNQLQLARAADVEEALLADLEAHGLIARRGGGYDADAVTVARTAGELAAFGIQPRHLRGFRAAADREAGLVEQVTTPLRRQRGHDAAAHADEVTREVSGLCIRLHAALVRSALERGGS